MNPVAEALTGWKQVEAAGSPLDIVFRIINEETRETVDNPCARVLGEGVIAGLANHTVLVARDGQERIIDDSAAPIRDAEGNIAGVVLIFRDVTERRHGEMLLQSQKDTLDMLVQGMPLPQVLESLARAMEKQSRHNVMTAIHLLDETRTRFSLAVAPSLPQSYCLATEGMEIASRTGPCCDAVLNRKLVAVTNVSLNSKWKAFAEFSLPLGIRAGWSIPIYSSGGEIVGTFANYYDEPREPDAHDIAVVEMLKDVGVPVNVKALDFGTLLQTLTKGTLPPNGGFAACRTSNNLDADDFVRDWATTTLVNWTPYPPDLMTLYQGTRRQVDPKKRLALLADLQRRVRDWAPVVALYQEVKVYALSARVLRFTPLPELNMDFRGVALKK
jgi:PAS domain S-box-containing protein